MKLMRLDRGSKQSRSRAGPAKLTAALLASGSAATSLSCGTDLLQLASSMRHERAMERPRMRPSSRFRRPLQPPFRQQATKAPPSPIGAVHGDGRADADDQSL